VRVVNNVEHLGLGGGVRSKKTRRRQRRLIAKK
jgi:hypothetical protein